MSASLSGLVEELRHDLQDEIQSHPPLKALGMPLESLPKQRRTLAGARHGMRGLLQEYSNPITSVSPRHLRRALDSLALKFC